MPFDLVFRFGLVKPYLDDFWSKKKLCNQIRQVFPSARTGPGAVTYLAPGFDTPNARASRVTGLGLVTCASTRVTGPSGCVTRAGLMHVELLSTRVGYLNRSSMICVKRHARSSGGPRGP